MAYRQSVGCRTCRALAPATWPPETTAANWPFRLGSKLYKAGPVLVVLRPDTTPVLRFNHVSAAMEKMLWSVLLLLPAGHNAAARLGAAEKRLETLRKVLKLCRMRLPVSIDSKSPRLTRNIVGKRDTVAQVNCVVRTLLRSIQLRKRNVPNAVQVAADNRETSCVCLEWQWVGAGRRSCSGVYFEYKGTAGTGRNVNRISASVHPRIVGVQQEPWSRLPMRPR